MYPYPVSGLEGLIPNVRRTLFCEHTLKQSFTIFKNSSSLFIK